MELFSKKKALIEQFKDQWKWKWKYFFKETIFKNETNFFPKNSIFKLSKFLETKYTFWKLAIIPLNWNFVFRNLLLSNCKTNYFISENSFWKRILFCKTRVANNFFNSFWKWLFLKMLSRANIFILKFFENKSTLYKVPFFEKYFFWKSFILSISFFCKIRFYV